MHSHCFLILKTEYVNITSKLTANQAHTYENIYLKGANAEYLY